MLFHGESPSPGLTQISELATPFSSPDLDYLDEGSNTLEHLQTYWE